MADRHQSGGVRLYAFLKGGRAGSGQAGQPCGPAAPAWNSAAPTRGSDVSSPR